MTDEIQKTALRLPKDLHSRIHNSAREAGISMNAQIVSCIEYYYDTKARLAHYEKELEENRIKSEALNKKTIEFGPKLDKLGKELTEHKLELQNLKLKLVSARDNPEQLQKVANMIVHQLNESINNESITDSVEPELDVRL